MTIFVNVCGGGGVGLICFVYVPWQPVNNFSVMLGQVFQPVLSN